MLSPVLPVSGYRPEQFPRLRHEWCAAWSFSQFVFCGLPQPNARTSSILVDELDARGFKRAANDIKGGATRSAASCFQLMNGHNANRRMIRESLLAPFEKRARGPALCRS